MASNEDSVDSYKIAQLHELMMQVCCSCQNGTDLRQGWTRASVDNEFSC